MTAGGTGSFSFKDNEHLKAFFDQCPLPIQIFDPTGLMVAVNPAWEELWQVEASEALGRFNVHDDPQLLELGFAADFDKVAGGESLALPEHEYDPERSGLPGRRRWLRSRLYPVRASDGKVQAVVVMHEDMTDQRESMDRYRDIVDNSIEAIVVVQDGTFVFYNQKALDIAGEDAQIFLSRSFIDFVHPADRKMVYDRHVRRLRGEDLPGRYEFRMIDGRGTVRWLDVNSQLIKWSGRPAVLVFLSEITDRKETEAQLLESEARFRAIAENTADMIHLNDLDGRILFANPATERILGYSLQEVVNHDAAEFIHPDDREVIGKDMGRIITGSDVPVRDIRLHTKGGDYLEFGVKGFSVDLGKNGKCMGAVFRDITARKNAERELHEYRGYLEKTLQHRTKYLEDLLVFSGEMIRSSDLRGLYRKVTLLSKDLLRLDFSTLMTLSEDGEKLVIQDTIGFSDSMVGTFSLVKGEGLSTWVVMNRQPGMVLDFRQETRFKVPPIVFEKNILSALCVPMLVGEDILGVLIGHTNAKKEFSPEEISLYQAFANQAAIAIRNSLYLRSVQESEQKFRTLFDNASDAIIIYDLEGGVAEVNDIACERLGYSRKELVGMDSRRFIAPDFAEKIRSRLQLVNERGSGIFETAHLARNGKRIPTELSCKRIQYDGVPAVLAVARDMTERQKMIKELLQVQKLESLGVLAGGIAHDFNNLLTAVMGNVSLAKLYLDPEDNAYKKLVETEKATMRAKDLTMQLLTFSKGGAPIRRVAEIGGIIRDSVEFVMRGSKAVCQFDLPGDLWKIEADSGQLAQVFQNLAINAVQAMPKGGIIAIAAANVTLGPEDFSGLDAGRYVRVTVSDQGGGIPEKYLHRIFDPYFTTKQHGSGLGLAAVFSIVRNHQGTITAESTPGAGATFVILLPATDAASGSKPARQQVAVQGAGGRILLMDDEKLVHQVASAMLQHFGYEVECVEDGTAAIAAYVKADQEGRPFAAVIMDLTIPGGMGGQEAVGKLHEVAPEARVIVSSGYANDPVMAEYARHGFAGVIPKPYRLEEISKVLAAVLQ